MTLSVSIFRHRDPARLLSGQLLSQICDKMMSLGLVWVISSEISPSWVTWFLAAGALPHLLMTWSSGQLLSRWGTLPTVIRTDLARAAIFILAGATWSQLDGSAKLPVLLAMTLAANFASALFNPAILSLPALLSDTVDLQQLNAGVDSCFTLSNVIGPVIAALLYPFLGLRGLFILNGLSYLLAAYLESGLKTRAEPSTEKPATAGSMVTSKTRLSPLDVLRGNTFLIFTLGAFALLNLFLTPLMAFLPLFAVQVFKGNISTLVIFETALGFGAVLGSLALTLTRSRMGLGKKSVIAIGLIALADVGFTLSLNVILSAACLFILGLALSVVNISMMTLFQTKPPEEHVPTVMTLVNTIGVGVLPFSMTLVGLLLLHFDLSIVAPVIAVVLVILALVTASSRILREAT